MSKAVSKRSTERRKKPRSASANKPSTKRSPSSSTTKKVHAQAKPEESCHNCSKDLRGEEKALFVEEEVGRIFCTEDCIAEYFMPEIERLERDYQKHLSHDLTGEQREKYAHLRWITLEEPDEVWREKTLAGDYRYTLISEFTPENKPIWCICICLFLRGEPSFLYLAFPTKNAAMANHYRKGERVQWAKPRREQSDAAKSAMESKEEGSSGERGPMIDGLADAWTEEETLRAQLTQSRTALDIPESEFSLYEACLAETLEAPDEVWTSELGAEDGTVVAASASEKAAQEKESEPDQDRDDASEDPLHLYHFIRHYPDEGPRGVWYVVVAKELEDGEQMEILDAFPTRDEMLVGRYRIGVQEIGAEEPAQTASRIVH
jgi:hypothetical protein